MIARLLLSALVVAGASPSSAQSPRPDARWQAWVGCWLPTGPESISIVPGSRLVCVIPAGGSSAVDILTLADQKIVSREHIEATGERRAGERDGCSGWERAEWSADARRVYLQSEYECKGGVKRITSGLLAMSLKGEWLNIAGVGTGDKTGVRVLRHRMTLPTSGLPDEIVTALAATAAATDAARTSAASPIGTPEIVDASQHLNAAVVEAWLNEIGQTFTMDAKRLITLADARVPDRVIDMMVALSYPRAFAIKPSPSSVGSLATGEGRTSAVGLIPDSPLLGCGVYGSGFSLYGWDPCSPYGDYSPYGYRYGYSPYSYLGYGYGGYTGWYVGGQPAIVLVGPSDSTTGSTHGRVVNGQGYTEGSSGSSATSSGFSSGGSSGGSSSGGGSSVSSGGDRTAQPR